MILDNSRNYSLNISNTTAVYLKFNDKDLQDVYANVPFQIDTVR